MNRGPAVCAVDVGTSAVRAAVVAPDGRQLRSVRRERPARERGPLFDAEHLWADVTAALRDLTGSTVGLEIRSVCFAAHIGQVLVDDSGKPVVEAGSWADTRGAATVAAGWVDVAAALQRAGRSAVTGGAVPLLSFLRTQQPDVYGRVRWVLAPKDFLVLRLTGVTATDATSAAYTFGSDVRLRRWDEDLLAPGGLALARFPPQHLATDMVGRVTAAGAAATGLPEGVPVAVGGPDGTVGASAVVGDRVGAVVDVAGTTDVLLRVIPRPEDAVQGTVLNPYLTRDLWSCGGATGMTGGAVAQWSHLLGFRDAAAAVGQWCRDAASLRPGADGLRISPLLTGSRFPDWNPHDTGLVWGMTERHTSSHFLQALHEACAYVARQAVDVLMRGDDPGAPVALAGGTARSPELAQLRADVLGRPILAIADADVSLRGAGLIALVAAGFYDSLVAAQAVAGPGLTPYAPDPERASSYARLFTDWLEGRQAITALSDERE